MEEMEIFRIGDDKWNRICSRNPYTVSVEKSRVEGDLSPSRAIPIGSD